MPGLTAPLLGFRVGNAAAKRMVLSGAVVDSKVALDVGLVDEVVDDGGRELGREIEFDAKRLARGDLLFWEGHVGIMANATHLLHANGFHMQTAIEPLSDAITRIGAPRRARRF